MRRFWSDLLASLYNIRDGIVQKKQELDEERAACEAEKEELRGQIAELEQNSNNSEESVVIEPVAVFQDYDGDVSIFPFNKSFITSGNAQLALYKIENFEEDSIDHNLYLKDGKIYFLESPFSPNINFEDLDTLGVLVTKHGYSQNTSYYVQPFVYDEQAFDYFNTKEYAINLEYLQIDAEIKDLNNLYFIVSRTTA